MLTSLAILCVATAWGSMLFFAAVAAPAVFRFLPAADASQFIRRLFPQYYLTLLIICALATLLLALQARLLLLDALLMAAVTLGFIIARQVLLPKINRLRDASQHDPGAHSRFKNWHKISVVINLIQMLIVLWVLWRLTHS